MPPGGKSQGDYSIRSVERVCDILDLLAAVPDDVSFSQIAEVTRLPRSSAFRYLATLEARGYAARGAASGYTLGPIFPPLKERRIEALVAAARPLMQRLSEKTGETINLGVLRGTRVGYVEIVESNRQVRLAAKVGDRDPIHCTALGKAIASRLDEAQVRRILETEGLPSRTEHTITDPELYVKVLDEVRERGYSTDAGENEPDGHCVAVAVPDLGINAAISLSAPAGRLPPEAAPEVAGRLQQLAREVAVRVGTEPGEG